MFRQDVRFENIYQFTAVYHVVVSKLALQIPNLCSQAFSSAGEHETTKEFFSCYALLCYAKHYYLSFYRFLYSLFNQENQKMDTVSINQQNEHSPLLIGEIDRVLLVVVVNLFVQFAGLSGQLVDLTPKSTTTTTIIFTSIQWIGMN